MNTQPPVTVPQPVEPISPDAVPKTPPPPGTVKDPFRTADWQPEKETEPPKVELPQIPGFEIEKELGRGGMGVVYRARQVPLHRTVALKMILAGDHASTDAKIRFLAEAEAIAKVQHPGIVQVFAFGTHQGNAYFVLEYIDGGSLDRVLSKGPLLAKDAVTLVAQLADAVQAAHNVGVVHRDLGSVLAVC
jgi:eukaryotic-like serine/threonine-protein kinase